MAVLLISSDFEEVERICHRALVFNRGRVVAEIPRNELTIARLTALAGGGEPPSTVEQRHDRRARRRCGCDHASISVWGLLILLFFC